MMKKQLMKYKNGAGKKASKAALAIMLSIGISCAMASARLSVSNVQINKRGETVSTTCLNTRGYYFEIGKPENGEHLTVYGFGGKMRLKTIVSDLLFDGWHAVYGKHVDTNEKINWMGHKAWTSWLKGLAFEKNLAVILDWKNKTVYLNRL